MTAQIPDVLVHDGSSLDLCDMPLDGYLRKLPRRRRPEFLSCSTACWRGYVATWEIKDGRLFLVGLSGMLRRGDEVIEADLVTAFPWMRTPYFAFWVDDRLRCPEGRLIRYEHMGFGSTYERDRWFDVRRGVVRGEQLCINPPRPVWYRIDAEGARHRFSGPGAGEHELRDPVPASVTPSWQMFRDEPMFEDSFGDPDEQGCVLAGYVTFPLDGR